MVKYNTTQTHRHGRASPLPRAMQEDQVHTHHAPWLPCRVARYIPGPLVTMQGGRIPTIPLGCHAGGPGAHHAPWLPCRKARYQAP